MPHVLLSHRRPLPASPWSSPNHRWSRWVRRHVCAVLLGDDSGPAGPARPARAL